MVNLTNIVDTIEKLAFDILSWAVYIPKTIFKIITDPNWVEKYVEEEIIQEKEEQFTDYMPPLIFVLVIIFVLLALTNQNPSFAKIENNPLLQDNAVSFKANYDFIWDSFEATDAVWIIADEETGEWLYSEWIVRNQVFEDADKAAVVLAVDTNETPIFLVYDNEYKNWKEIRVFREGKDWHVEELNHGEFKDDDQINSMRNNNKYSSSIMGVDGESELLEFIIETPEEDQLIVYVEIWNEISEWVDTEGAFDSNALGYSITDEIGYSIADTTNSNQGRLSDKKSGLGDLSEKASKINLETAILQAISFLVFPFLISIGINLINRQPTEQKFFKRFFYIQCYFFSPVIFSAGILSISLNYLFPRPLEYEFGAFGFSLNILDIYEMNVYNLSQILFIMAAVMLLMSILWLVVVETKYIAKEINTSKWKALLGLLLLSLLIYGVYDAPITIFKEDPQVLNIAAVSILFGVLTTYYFLSLSPVNKLFTWIKGKFTRQSEVAEE